MGKKPRINWFARVQTVVLILLVVGFAWNRYEIRTLSQQFKEYKTTSLKAIVCLFRVLKLLDDDESAPVPKSTEAGSSKM